MPEVTDENFDTEILKSDKTILVDFWAEWCPPCKAMLPIVEKIAESVDDSVKIIKVNVEQAPNISSKYGIYSIPTFLIFKQGEETERMIGAVSEQALLDKLN